MKKRNLIIAFCLAAAIGSCTKDDGADDFTPELVQMTISAKEADSEVKTRVGYDREGTTGKFRWNSGDRFSFFSYNSSVQANGNIPFSTTSTTAQGIFSGTATTWDGTQNIFAVYPFNSTAYTISSPADMANATATFTLPNPQTYTVGGSLNNAFMVASTNATVNNVSLSFKQVMSIIKFDITNVPSNEVVQGVSIDVSGEGLALSGTAKMADGTLLSKSSYTYYHKVNVIAGAVAGTPTTVQMALFPVDLSAYTVNIIVRTNKRPYGFTKTGTNFERNERTSISLNLASQSLLYPGGPSNLHSAIGRNAVYVPGTDTYWAPFNCNANEYSIYGTLFQWGRRIGFHYVDPPTANAPTSAPLSGYMYGNTSTYWNADILNKNSWLDLNTSYAGNPCPYGWTVPSVNQLQSLAQHARYDYSWYTTSSIVQGMYLSGDGSGAYVFLINHCYFQPAPIQAISNESTYWARELWMPGQNAAYRLWMNNVTLQINYTFTGTGGFVRCVKELY